MNDPWPVGKISPLGPGYHRTGPGTWHEHHELGHEHTGGDYMHLHPRPQYGFSAGPGEIVVPAKLTLRREQQFNFEDG